MLWATYASTFPKEKASKRDTAGQSASGQQFASYSARKCTIGCRLGPTIVLNGCRPKGLTKLPWKSDTEFGEHQQSRTLRFGKHVQHGRA